MITFLLKFNTTYGENLCITGNHPLLGSGDVEKAVPLSYFKEGLWRITLDIPLQSLTEKIIYNYVLKYPDGSIAVDNGKDKIIHPTQSNNGELVFIDSWNYAGYYQNAFFTVPFSKVLLKEAYTPVTIPTPIVYTHTFQVKAPLLQKGETICLLGNGADLNNWEENNPILLARKEDADVFQVQLNLQATIFPIAYKYGIYNVTTNKFIQFEDGSNRYLESANSDGVQTIVHDGYVNVPLKPWKGAGVAIPVFSLRTEQSFGVGEFSDLLPYIDWCKKVGLKLLQLLPVNDTTATHSWLDSYPYAAISAFALHPIYINLNEVATEENRHLLAPFETERIRINSLPTVDYEAVLNLKLHLINQLYPLQKEATFSSEGFKDFFSHNQHWLIPYSVFCYLRDEYGTAHFDEWPAHNYYNAADIALLTDASADSYDGIAINYFIQYHLHLQLKAATEYAHENGIIVKGDIPIGIYRYGADAWQQPTLYHMEVQAGAPPDDFAIKGQNWGFPTYNWEAMRADGFLWWKQRFEQMSFYFDAFRIDHILGFFRIWNIPIHAVEGIMGFFSPAIPIYLSEFNEKGIWFDYNRYCKPFINEQILWEIFGTDNDLVKEQYLNGVGNGYYQLKEEYVTQRQVEYYFNKLEETDHNKKIKYGLFDLISNVILFEQSGSNGTKFHFRFSMEQTTSFKYLDGGTQQRLKDLYVNYFFRRQDDFWMKEAMQKLPALKRVTNMLICGEDLGLVPTCVPDLMKQLGILSLEIQRMPKNPKTPFFHPNDAPYMSVVTPSTHDMSTIRGWWEEDKTRIQQFYNKELGQWGPAPYYCEPWVNKIIVEQHLYAPAMWSIFQWQDLMGIDKKLRRENPQEERINVPANPKHYWRYRMHIGIEALLKEADFNATLKESILKSGR